MLEIKTSSKKCISMGKLNFISLMVLKMHAIFSVGVCVNVGETRENFRLYRVENTLR